MAALRMKGVEGTNIVVRRDSILCTVCLEVEPIHPGDGTPLPSLLIAYQGAVRRHPPEKHARQTMPPGGSLLADAAKA